MIDKETLQKIAKLMNLRPWQQEKHYIQTVLLVALSDHPLLFKGGTYLWFFHGLPRFSEDLDFTCSEKVPSDLPERVCESLRLFGIENEIKREKPTLGAFSFRISAKGPLNSGEIDLCHVYVEISRRETPILPPISFPFIQDQYALPSKVLAGMALDEVAAEKVRAIMTRDKARDLYDLSFLIEKKGVRFDEEMINAKLAHYEMKFSRKEFDKKIIEKKKFWKSELLPLVFDKLPAYEDAQKNAKDWAG